MTAINLNTDSLTLTIQEAGEANTNSKAGGTAGLVNTKVGVNTPLKGITGGTNITVSEGTNDVVIAVTNDYDNIDVAPKPDVNASHALGSTDKTWSDLYLSNFRVQNANARIEIDSDRPVMWEQGGQNFEVDTGAGNITLTTGGSNQVIVDTGTMTVNGNLDVNGTTTTIDTTNLSVSDKVIELNRGAASNSSDAGFIVERGSTGDNATIFWDEDAGRWTLGTTTSTGTETGNFDNVTKGTLNADIASTGSSLFSGTVDLNGATVNNASFNLSGNLTGDVLGDVRGDVKSTSTNGVVLDTSSAIASYTGDVDGRIGETTRATGKFTSLDADGNIDAYRGIFTSGINANSTSYGTSNFMVYDNDSIPAAVSALTMVRYLGSDGALTSGFDSRGATMDWEVRSDSGNSNGSATNIYVGGVAGYSKHDNDTHQMHFFVYDNGHTSYTRVNGFWFDKNHVVLERRTEILADLYTEGDAEFNLQDASGTVRVIDHNDNTIFEVDEDKMKLDVPLEMKVYAVNDLPTDRDEGTMAYVTNESTVTGGNCMVFYDGAGWKLMHSPTTTASQ